MTTDTPTHPAALRATHRPQIDVTSSSAAQRTALLTALRSARHPVLDGPLVLARPSAGSRTELVSVTPDGTAVHVWTPAEAARLASAVADPVRPAAKGVKPATHWAAAITRLAFEDALMSGNGPAVCGALTDHPVLSPSGAVLSEPGWYPDHGVWILDSGSDWAGYAVQGRLDRAAAQAALDHLDRELLGGFLFASPGDHARAVAYLLTCSVRDIIPSSPAWVATSAASGAGKGLLLAVGRTTANGSGRHLAVSPSRRDDQRTMRALAAELSCPVDHVTFAHIDDLGGHPPTSLDLAALVTTQDGQTALLRSGVADEVAVRQVIVTMAGVSARAEDGWARRSLPITLGQPETGCPEDQGGFRHPDLTGWTIASRGSLLGAAHTVLARGLRERLEPAQCIDSFPAWSRVVLGALSDLHLGGESRPVAELVLDGWDAWRGQPEARSARTEAA